MAPRELGQPHCEIMASEAGDKAFVLNLWEMFCKADMFATNTQRDYPRHPPCVSLSRYAELRGLAYLYPRMLKCAGSRTVSLSMYVC